MIMINKHGTQDLDIKQLRRNKFDEYIDQYLRDINDHLIYMTINFIFIQSVFCVDYA